MKKKILFVCLGNICRSPAAEGIMRHMADNRRLSHLFEIDSCGIGPWHVGELPDARMRQHAFRHGYRLTHHARQIGPEDFSRFDHIFVMDRNNYQALSKIAPDRKALEKVEIIAQYLTHHPHVKEVPDPYYGGEDDFEYAIELLEDACAEIIERTSITN